LPFVLVMVGMAVALVKDLRHDPLVVRKRYAAEAVDSAVIHGVTEHGDDFIISVEKDPAADN
jgi:choline-glycine betaine transporter